MEIRSNKGNWRNDTAWRRATRLERIGEHLLLACEQLVEALRLAFGGRL
jgi:hypothetical protein